MIFQKGKIEHIEVYKDFKIVIEHNLNLVQKTTETDYPIYTICKLGRTYQGTIENVRQFIDEMIRNYS